jgi:hypothetical protein
VTALPPLAALEDLSARGVTVPDGLDPEVALAAASAAVRDAAGCPISSVTSTITEVLVADGPWLTLPSGPVTGVASVVGPSGTVTGWVLISGRLYRGAGWPCAAPQQLTVTYTHGLAVVPADIVDLVCSLAAARLYSDPTRDPSVTSETIGNYRAGFSTEPSKIGVELPERTRTWLRQRFGTTVHVTGR